MDRAMVGLGFFLSFALFLRSSFLPPEGKIKPYFDPWPERVIDASRNSPPPLLTKFPRDGCSQFSEGSLVFHFC